jgi:acyl dehydratase
MSPSMPADLGEVRQGTVLPPLERTIRLIDMVAYAGATWDWHPMHFDQDEAARIGAPAPVVDGQMFGAHLAEQVLDWLGPRARILRMSFRLRRMVFAGEAIRVDGEVREVTGGDNSDVIEVDQLIRVGDRVVVEGRSTAEVRGERR